MQARIVVKPQDRFSNPVSSACADPAQAGFQIDLVGPASPLDATWDLASASHGELAATYLPILTGTCSIAVKYQGQHVQGSPYQVSFTGSADMICCSHASHSGTVVLLCCIVHCKKPCLCSAAMCLAEFTNLTCSFCWLICHTFKRQLQAMVLQLSDQCASIS